MKIYKKSLALYLYTSLATWGLGLALLIPFLNNHLLNKVIEAETGINTRYYWRPFYYNVLEKKR